MDFAQPNSTSTEVSAPTIVGSTEFVTIEGISNIPAKIDTGADSSSVWVSDLDVSKDGVLSFVLFSQNSSLYSGERIERKDFSVAVVRSSNGHEQVRYRTKLTLELGGKTLDTTFTLASREKNHFPVLVGRKTLNHGFLVDVSIRKVEKPQNPATPRLNDELKRDPYLFHQKHFN